MVDDGCTTEGCTGDPNLYKLIILIGRQKIVSELPESDDSYESDNQSRLHERAVEYGRGGETNVVRGADAAGAINSLLGAQAEANIINATPNNVFFSAVYVSSEGIPFQDGNTTTLEGVLVNNWSKGVVKMVGIELKSPPVVRPTFCVNCNSKRIDPTNLNGDPMTIGKRSSSEISVNYPVNYLCPFSISVGYNINPVPEGWNPLWVYRFTYH